MRLGIVVSACLSLIPVASIAQATGPQLQALQTQTAAALLGSAKATSITLDGFFTSTEGSLKQQGNVHVVIGSDGTSRIDLPRSRGAISEIRTMVSGIPQCTWLDQAGHIHNSTFPNCIVPNWVFPGITLLVPIADLSFPRWTLSTSTRDSLGAHLQYQLVVSDSEIIDQTTVMALFDLIVSPDTHLPIYSIYTVHPDTFPTNATISMKIAYSDYRNVSGTMIPFHIQRYMNGNLILDLSFTSAQVQ